jgi:hypothetical protein
VHMCPSVEVVETVQHQLWARCSRDGTEVRVRNTTAKTHTIPGRYEFSTLGGAISRITYAVGMKRSRKVRMILSEEHVKGLLRRCRQNRGSYTEGCCVCLR